MSGFLRLLGAATIVGALAILLRELFRERPELMSAASSDQVESKRKASPRSARSDIRNDGGGQSREELYEEAQRLGIKGRSRMKKSQLKRAVENAREATG